MEITFTDVEHVYSKGTPFEHLAITGVNVNITESTYYAIIGHTGSGKSTIIQHLNGLLQPTSGTVQIGDAIITNEKNKQLKPIRKKVGVVFQFPEHQLFEETVEKDIAFGPTNFGVDVEKAKEIAREKITLVGLSEEYLERSPFELSGGQMRRVAIAGVLAMEPEVLVLDEPTAGLDPEGQRDLMDMFYELQKEKNLTIVLVTHSMEDAARYADHLIVLHKGRVFTEGKPADVFMESESLEEIGLTMPLSLQYQKAIEDKLGIQFCQPALTIEQLTGHIVGFLSKGGQ